MPKPRFNKSSRKRGVPSSTSRLKTCCQTASSGRLPFTFEDAIDQPALHMKKVSAEIWEEVQEEIMRRTFCNGQIYGFDDSVTHADLLDEHFLSNLYFKGVHVSRLHRDIAKIVMDNDGRLARFELLWEKVLEEDVRKGIVVDALEHTTDTTVAFGPLFRRYCPDLTVSSLAIDNNGHGFIQLIRRICQSAIAFTQVEDYYPIPSKAFDSYYEIDWEGQDASLPLSRSARTFQTWRQHDRNQFVGDFALAVLKRIDWVPETFLPATVVEKPRKLNVCECHTIRGFVVPTTCSCEACHESMREACTACRRYPDEIEGEEFTKFLYCQNCLSTSTPHKVPYCSTDCSTKDWILGNHKKWCGRSLTDLALPPAGWSRPPSIPPLSLRLQRHLYDRDVRDSPRLYGSLHVPLLYQFLTNEAAIRSSNSASEEFSKSRLLQVFGASPFDSLLPLLFKALDSRDDQAIAQFVSWLVFYVNDIPDFSDDPAIQLAADWGVEIGEMREWVNEGLRWNEEEAARTVDDLRGDFKTLGMLGED